MTLPLVQRSHFFGNDGTADDGIPLSATPRSIRPLRSDVSATICASDVGTKSKLSSMASDFLTDGCTSFGSDRCTATAIAGCRVERLNDVLERMNEQHPHHASGRCLRWPWSRATTRPPKLSDIPLVDLLKGAETLCVPCADSQGAILHLRGAQHLFGNGPDLSRGFGLG